MVLRARGALGTSPIDGYFQIFSTTESPIQTHFSIQHKTFFNPGMGLKIILKSFKLV